MSGSVKLKTVPLALILVPDKPLNCKNGIYSLCKFPLSSVFRFKYWFANCAFGKDFCKAGASKYKSLNAIVELLSNADTNEFCGFFAMAAKLSY